MAQVLIIDEDCSTMDNWYNYNSSYWNVTDVPGKLTMKGAGPAGYQYASHTSVPLVAGDDYIFEYNLSDNYTGTIWIALGGEGVGSLYNISSQGTGWHQAYLIADDTYAVMKLKTGGPPGSPLGRFDWMKLYHVPPGKKVLVNNRPIQNLVNKGL